MKDLIIVAGLALAALQALALVELSQSAAAPVPPNPLHSPAVRPDTRDCSSTTVRPREPAAWVRPHRGESSAPRGGPKPCRG
jgi:hypothetical protein